MKRAVTLFSLLSTSFFAYSQCTIQGFSSRAQISCGDSVTLSAFGNGSGNVAFQENFNSGSPTGWQFTQTVTIANNTCGRPAPDGSNFMWMGDASVNPRDMTTVPFDLSLGGTICFEMRYSIQGDASPCEGPDEPQEGVYVQYSTNGGANWTNIQYWNPNGGNDPQLTNWNQYCVVIPPGAMTANTMIRWHQDAVSGAEYDHWGIDNVIITLNDPNFVITWLHDGYSYGFGSSGGINPTRVKPTTTTNYTVQISDGTNTCTDVVTVTVVDPVIVVDAGRDTTLCPGECVTIDADAYWQVEPPGPRRFVNDVPQSISAGLGTGGTVNIPINVNGLNLGSIQAGSILEVCITGMTYFGAMIALPPVFFNIGAFSIVLKCPGGTSITLVPSGVTTSSNLLNGYTQTCFSMTATNNIASATAPYTNTYAPSQSFNNLAGCAANGTWTMSLVSNSPLSVGSGNFDGWSITFDDPGLTAPVNYSWNPTTNMTNQTTLNPTICPDQTSTYTLTATNSPGCRPGTDNITITVPNSCCQLQVDNVAVQNPSCTTNNGQITITTSGGITGLRYSINNGTTFQPGNSFTGLGPGTYEVVVNDDNNCAVHRTITLTNPNAPAIDNIQPVHPTCVGNNGSVTLTVSGGTPAYTYSIDGTTFQSGNSFTGLAPGNYTLTVRDAAGCSSTGTVTLNAPAAPTISTLTYTAANCGATDGSATVTVTGGSAPYTYAWSPSGGTAATAANIGGGSYTVTVTDAQNCSVSGSITVTTVGGPTVAIVQQEDVTCFGLADGGVQVEVTSGGTAPYAYSWAPSGGTGNLATNLTAGTYTVTVTDVDNCVGSLTVTLTQPDALAASQSQTPTECGFSNGTATVNSVTGGTAPYAYTWSVAGSGNGLTNLAAGTYSATVTDNNGCTLNVPFTIGTVVTDSTLAFTVATTEESCVSNDGSATVTVTNGKEPYSYQWSGGTGVTTATANGLAAGTYTVTVKDLCYSLSQTVTIDKSFSKPDKNLPNVFTPNLDGANDLYTVDDNFSDTQGFFCIIYNRWGNVVYQTENKKIDWAPKGLSDGVYFLVLTYTDCLGEAEKIASTITLAAGK